jgi:peptidoglycan/LPS O-acetylase OafA/YrhL
MSIRHSVNLEAALGARRDNFLPLRHLAALLVIYGHSYSLTAHAAGQVDWIARWMPGFYAGSLAVFVFFAISGYLVTAGLLRKPGFWRYVRHRFLRVYPAYLLCLLLVAFALGPVFTSLSLSDYLRDGQTWTYLGTNLSPIKLAWTLPGVFVSNPYPNVVNGTLWSLGLEVRWYAYLAVLALLGIVRRRWAFTVVVIAFLTLASWEWWTGKPDPLLFRSLSMVFMATALMAHWRDRIWINHWTMIALLMLCMLTHGSIWFGVAAIAATSYATFWIAYALPRVPWPGNRDYSYGLFLFGFPVQQSLVACFPGIAPMQLFASSTLLALILAFGSWHLVERPMLRFKN